MNKKNTTILIGAAILFYIIYRYKNKTSQQPGLTQEQIKSFDDSMQQVDVIKSQTVNFPQIVPTPSMIMDMPKPSKNYGGGCCSNKGITGLPFVC